MPSNLTLLAPIRAGEETRLRDVLRAIGDDIKGRTVEAGSTRPHIDFPRSRTTHFARFAILLDPQRGARATRLLFASIYDGTLEAHLAELIALTADADAIWGRCDGYTGADTFAAFVRAHARNPEAFYRAFRDEHVESIRRGASMRRFLRTTVETASTPSADTLRAQAAAAGLLRDARHRPSASQAARAFQRLARALPVVADFVRAISRAGMRNVFRAARQIILSLDRYPLFRFTNWLTSNRMPARRSPCSSVELDSCRGPEPLAPGDEVPAAFATPPTFREDVITQNQLTLVTLVDPAGVPFVKAVMSAIDSYAKRLAPDGSLIGIGTIHFVRWLLIDDDRRLVMVSDYDGSWENYIDEFAEMILSGLDAIWGTACGYPQDGARDLPAFKRFLRTHQVPAEVFYSAYPDQTILNIKGNLALVRALEAGGDELESLLPTL